MAAAADARQTGMRAHQLLRLHRLRQVRLLLPGRAPMNAANSGTPAIGEIMTTETSDRDRWPLLDFDAIEREIAEFAAGTDSESGDAPHNPDIWELRSRLEQMSGHTAALVADCRRKLTALVEVENERDRLREELDRMAIGLALE